LAQGAVYMYFALAAVYVCSGKGGDLRFSHCSAVFHFASEQKKGVDEIADADCFAKQNLGSNLFLITFSLYIFELNLATFKFYSLVKFILVSWLVQKVDFVEPKVEK